MKIATYNVNGIASRLGALLEWLAKEAPDVACLQELKAADAAFPIIPIRAAGYGAIGAALGTRGSARMVGWAMMAVPYAPKPVPAHRVVNRAGLLTGRHHYTPPEKMQQLLEKEGVKVKDNKVVDFKKLFWDPSLEL